MFCPVCKSEYRSGFTICSDCQVQLVPELPEGALMKPRGDILLSADGPVAWIQRSKITSWFFALSVGLLFSYLYGFAKNGIWSTPPARKLANAIADMIDDSSEFSIVSMVLLNFIAELSSSLIPALICGALLILCFQKKANLFTVGALAPFLILDSRLWRYWNASDLGLGSKIIGFAAPLLVGLVFVSIVWLLGKKKDYRTK